MNIMYRLNDKRCIDNIDNLFEIAEARYEKLFVLSPPSAPFDLMQVKESWQNDPFNPLLIISTKLIKYYRGIAFKKEINDNIEAGNITYFDYVANVVRKRINFINGLFPKTVSIYFNEDQKQADLLTRLYDKAELSKGEFITAVQLDFIEKCQLLEIVYRKHYAVYKPQLIAGNYPTDIDGNFQPILLKYKEKNDDVLRELHRFLYDRFIEEDYEVFASHFANQTNELRPIRWKGNLMQLYMLFAGANLKDTKLTRIVGVKTSNPCVKRMIATHFCDINGKEFNIGSMYTYSARLAGVIGIKGSELFVPFLKKIN